jgi:hypothetical protein
MKDKDVQELFISGVHHKSISVIFLTQNVYCEGKFSRDIRLNTHYYTIFKTPTFKYPVKFLGQQLFPEKPKFLYDAYKIATPAPYTYLFLSLHPTTPEELQVQSGILPGEEHFVYAPK